MRKVFNFLFKKSWILIIVVVAFLWILSSIRQGKPSEPAEIRYTAFMEMVEQQKVASIELDYGSPTILFKDKDGKEYITDNPRDEDFKKRMLEAGIEKIEEVSKSKSVILDVLSLFLPIIMTIIFYTVIFRSFKKGFGNKLSAGRIEQTTKKQGKKDMSNVNFSNIAGSDETKEEMRYLVDFLKNPKKYSDMGARLPKGVIFHGPPGTGKTLMARAIAGEAGVPFYNVCGSDFVQMYVGVGASRVRELFDKAKHNAPCIIFIDEIDAIGMKRGYDTNSERDQTINALLNEMDGFDGSEGIIIIAGTNKKEKLDDALIRPGRFDKHITINLPDLKDRYEILKIHSKNKKLASDIDLNHVAKMTIGFSGAGLETLLNEATILAVNRNQNVVTMKDIDDAYFKVIMEGDKKKNPSDRTQHEISLTAWHEAGHALVAKLKTNNAVPKVSIVPTTSGAGGVTVFTPQKLSLYSKEELYGLVMACYGGRAAEYILLGDENKVTTGAVADIQDATERLKRIIGDYGMSEAFGLINLEVMGVDKKEIAKEATDLSKKLYKEAIELLSENKTTLENIAKALIEKETIDEVELDSIIKNTTKGV